MEAYIIENNISNCADKPLKANFMRFFHRFCQIFEEGSGGLFPAKA
jgi:hypothetical protein